MPANVQTVVVHPLVLLSTVDHYYRVAKVPSPTRTQSLVRHA